MRLNCWHNFQSYFVSLFSRPNCFQNSRFSSKSKLNVVRDSANSSCSLSRTALNQTDAVIGKILPFYPGNSTRLITIFLWTFFLTSLLYSWTSPVQLPGSSATNKGHWSVNVRDKYRTACALYCMIYKNVSFYRSP